MSNENDFVASLNRLENLIDSNQTDLKREVESIIDRRFISLKEEIAKLKSSHPSLDKITDLLSLLAEEDSRHNLCDLPDRIRAILSTITSNYHVQRQTPDLDVSEIGDNVTVNDSVNIPDELGTEGHVNDIETNVPSTGATNDGTHLIQIDIPENGEVLGDNQNESLPEEPNETNQDISALAPASPSDIPVIIKVEGSSSSQSVRVCKRWMAEIAGEDLWYCDCGSDECRVKQEIKDEFEIEINDQSVQLCTQVKEEVESGEENVIGPENGDELNVNPNESLHEQSNGMTLCSVNVNPIDNQQVDNGGHEPSEPVNDEYNESQTSKQSKIHKRKRTVELLAPEQANSDSLGPALSSVSTAIEHDQTTDETGFNCSNYIEVYTDMDQHQINTFEGGEVLGDNQNEHLTEESNETNQDISALVPASPSDIPVIIKVEGSSSPQSVRVCKRWMAEIDGEDLWYCDCGSDECRVKQEIKDEFVETGEFEIEINDQSVQLGTQVKEEVESGEENVIGPEDGDEVNDSQNESLSEQSNGTNQCFVNVNPIDNQQVDHGGHESSVSAIDECNESQTSKQSKIRKRKRTCKSLATESENLLENSLPNREVSTQITIPRSKRIRVTSPLETETTKQLSTGSEVDSSEGDNPNGNGPRGEGEKGADQSEDEESWCDSETELGDEDDEGGRYKIRTIKLKCTEDSCNAEVSNRVELHDHLRVKHHISPHRCLAEGCNESFEQWNELGNHVQYNHSNISAWPCPHCIKTFQTQHRLYQHLYMYHFEGQFKCGYDGCHYDRVATLRSEIKIHQLSVHPKSTIFTCQINDCGKAFNQLSNFNRHQQIHTNDKSFRCDWIGCGKSFNDKSNLNTHKRIHLGVRPFECAWNKCDYVSTQHYNVIKHIRTQHFGLPATLKEQHQLGIVDNRNPRDHLLNTTTHQSGH